MKKLTLLFAAIVALCCSMTQDDTHTMFMIGDSTMANKDTTKGPERGWGMMVQELFDETQLIVDNHAVNGRSSKSFIDEGRWQVVLDKIKPGDYVVIQFGHNDEKSGDRHTEPGSTFDDNLRKFVNETRAKGGKPILMNACVRRNFYKKVPKNDDDEALRNTTAAGDPAKSAQTAGQEEGDILYDTHGYYRYSPREVALETGAVFVDANKLTHQLEQALGRERSKKIHMWYAEGEIPEIPQGRQDNTHYNIVGAKAIARLLVDGMCKEMPELYRYMKGGRMPGFGGPRGNWGQGQGGPRGNWGQGQGGQRGNGQRGNGQRPRGNWGQGQGGFGGNFGGGFGNGGFGGGFGDDNGGDQ